MRSRKTIAALLFAVACIVHSPAAAQQSSGLETLGRAVSDEELGDMRGKFISPQGVGYFGVQMQTLWQGPDGVATRATLLFSVNFRDGAGNPQSATPMLLVGWTRDGESGTDVTGFTDGASGNYVTLQGLADARGVVQSQVIAGSDNRVRNNMQVAIVPLSSVQAGSTEGLTALTASQTQQFANGGTVQFILDGNQVAMALNGPGAADAVRQSFNGGIGQAAQNVNLTSSGNTIHNAMGITVGYDQLQQSARVNLDNSIAVLKGISF